MKHVLLLYQQRGELQVNFSTSAFAFALIIFKLEMEHAKVKKSPLGKSKAAGQGVPHQTTTPELG